MAKLGGAEGPYHTRLLVPHSVYRQRGHECEMQSVPQWMEDCFFFINSMSTYCAHQ